MTTGPERFRKLDEVFRRALAADPSERDRVIDDACAGDTSLAAEARALLEADAIEHTLTLGVPTADAPQHRPESDPASDARPPERIGAYTLESPIGRGGMGVVYRARREHPSRTVALKILRRAIEGENTHRRFRLEAQALARLQHPGIAALYEIGVGEDEDRPYFAMELIDGRTITAHADELGLSDHDRLGLLARVCDAIEHAHTRGVVHRDLKPENVLVTNEGDPKVLDLGIAKLLDDEGEGHAAPTAVTEAGQIVGTLGYMSPEQVSGDPLAADPRCDVYALGVIGYELLAGRRPIETTGMGVYAAVHHIRHTEPVPLRTARPGVDPDAATILDKAIAKDPDARYQSAAQLAADLRRLLADEPILARPPSTLYQLTKFAKRNRLLVGSVAAVVSVLAVSLVAVLIALQTARDAQRRAEADRETTAAVNAFLLDDLIAAADPRRGGSKHTSLIDALNAASDGLGDRFEHAPGAEAAIRAALGDIYSTLNDFPKATSNIRRALDLTTGDDPGLRVDRLNALALLHMDLDEFDQAEAALDEADSVLLRVRGEDRRELEILASRARLQYKRGDREAALILYTIVADAARAVLPPDDPITLAALGAVSLIHQQQDRLDEALPASEEAVRLYERHFGPESPDTLTTLTNHAMLLTKLERFDEAEAVFQRVLDTRLRTLGPDNVDTGVTRMVYAQMLLRAGRDAEARPLAEAAHAGLLAALGPEHRYTINAAQLLERAGQGP